MSKWPIAPSVDETIKFESLCDLSGDYEVLGNANGCSCLQVAAGQNISSLTLKVDDFSTFDKNVSKEHYQILHTPDGFTGKFTLLGNWSSEWGVKYTATAAYITPKHGMMIFVR